MPGARIVPAIDAASAAAAIPADIDIVHAHGWVEASYGKPALKTLHGNAPGYGFEGNWNFISADHAARHGRETFVYNGVPPEDAAFSATKSDRHLFLSRINRAGKNVTRAVDLARKFDLKLDLAGGSRIDLLTRSQVRREGVFFRTLDGRFRFHGLVGGSRKAELLASARSLLFPIRWDEPFGLVVVEALLAGTSVVATPRGAVPEIVNPEVGFLCETDAEFGEAFSAVADIRPALCREFAADQFSAARMAEGYLTLYRRILDGETLG